MLSAISPIDGRYRSQVHVLAPFFSEQALIRYRVWVEIEYFIALVDIPLDSLKSFPSSRKSDLRALYENFSEADAQAIKTIENTTKHDVKAVEYFLKAAFDRLNLSDYKEFVHFGLTSQDINNTAQPAMFRDALQKVLLPSLDQLILRLENLSSDWMSIPMLAKTHGQPASPTILGKEMGVFVERLKNQRALFQAIPFAAKLGGATGNFNAHHVAYPQYDWVAFANTFVEKSLGLHRSQWTTQVEHYDYFAAQFDALKRINTILLDMCRDFWTYISMEYFKQKIRPGEVGSSAMPHKVNPIDFENAEGNLGIANALFEHLSAKLPISRLQRDLTDSTVFRNMGVPVAHMLLSLRSIEKGLEKLMLNENAIHADLENNWAVVAEAIQTILRREAYPNPYEALKDLTRTHDKIDAKSLAVFIQELDVPEPIKDELRAITPFNYTGVFQQ